MCVMGCGLDGYIFDEVGFGGWYGEKYSVEKK